MRAFVRRFISFAGASTRTFLSTNSKKTNKWALPSFLLILSSTSPRGLSTTTTTGATAMKELIIVRHGQAQHNPRAEVAKANGCSMEEFIALMREDDVLDAALTEEGRRQAQAARLSLLEFGSSVRLVVSSSLSRALETADHVHPPLTASDGGNVLRVCYEHFREVNGDMLNAKRRTKSELAELFPHWDFGELDHEEDALWTTVMEDLGAAAERGYLGFKWLMERPEDNILLVSHGGILRYAMNDHPLVVLRDGRSSSPHTAGSTRSGNKKPVESRFDNCEMRRYRLSWGDKDTAGGEDCRRPIILTQIDETFEPNNEL